MPTTGSAVSGRGQPRRDYARIGVDCVWIWGGRRLPPPFPRPCHAPVGEEHMLLAAVPVLVRVLVVLDPVVC
jgi:hypothetical protein